MTSVPRTIFDLAATESEDVVENLLREMEFLELWDRLSLPYLMERYPGKRGVRKAPPSPALPRFNDWIFLNGKSYQVDCHWPGTREIVELDGWKGHRTRTAFREDRARDRALRVAGYSVTRLTWNQLDDEPEAVSADLRVLLGIER